MGKLDSLNAGVARFGPKSLGNLDSLKAEQKWIVEVFVAILVQAILDQYRFWASRQFAIFATMPSAMKAASKTVMKPAMKVAVKPAKKAATKPDVKKVSKSAMAPKKVANVADFRFWFLVSFFGFVLLVFGLGFWFRCLFCLLVLFLGLVVWFWLF